MQNQLTFSVITELENVEKKSSFAFLSDSERGKAEYHTSKCLNSRECSGLFLSIVTLVFRARHLFKAALTAI